MREPSAQAGSKSSVRILVAIAAAALACKLAVFLVSVGTSMSFSLPSIENWQDFSLAYVPAVNALKSGFLPYRDFYYPYPPLFLYALTLPSYLPLPSWSSALPSVIADALTAVPVYLIAREFVGERYSLVASAVFVLAPTSLFYADYLWLNPPLTTLFLVVSVYLLIKGRYDLSAVALAVSIGFKQTALLVLPVVMLILWRENHGRRGALRYFAITALICFLISVPFVIISPAYYLDSVFSVPTGAWSVGYFPPGYWSLAVGTGTQVSFNTLNWLTSRWQALATYINAPVTLALPAFIFLAPSATWAYAFYSSVLQWILLFGSYAILLFSVGRNKAMVSTDVVKYVLCALLVFFTFYPLYKYYVVGMIPFLALLVRSKKDILGFAAFNLALLFVPRYFASWILMAALLWIFRGDLLRLFRRPTRTLSQSPVEGIQKNDATELPEHV